MYLFYNSTCFERLFRSSSGVHDLLYSAALYKPCKRVCKADTFAWFVHKSVSCWFVYKTGYDAQYIQCQKKNCSYVEKILEWYLPTLSPPSPSQQVTPVILRLVQERHVLSQLLFLICLKLQIVNRNAKNENFSWKKNGILFEDTVVVLWCYGSSTPLWNVYNYLLVDTAWHPIRLDSSSTLLWELRICQHNKWLLISFVKYVVLQGQWIVLYLALLKQEFLYIFCWFKCVD